DPTKTPGVTLWGGTDRADFIRIAGSFKDENRINTCVTKGFACGLNPIVPLNYLRRFKTCTPFFNATIAGGGGEGCAPQPPCSLPASALSRRFRDKWQSLDAEKGPLGCPVGPERNIIDNTPPHRGYLGSSQDFEGGQMAYSPMIGIYGDTSVNLKPNF